ncbi:Acetylcholinesterase, partial [Stegodyphus mimosarum]
MSGIASDVLLHAVYTEYVYRQDTTSHHKKRRQQQHEMSNGSMPYYENPSSALPDIRTLGKIISDIDLKAPSVKLVNLLSLRPSVSVYMYEFDYASSDDVIVTKYVGANNTWVGSYHESELYYIFGFPHMNLDNALRLPQDKEVSDILIQLWTDFAKSGNPTPRRDPSSSAFKNFTWRSYREEEDYFATLGLQPFVARSYESERMTFWNHFVPLFTEYPITITSNLSEAAKPQVECSVEVIILLSFVGWLLSIICLGLIIHLCLCKNFRYFTAIRNLPIPI